MPVIHSVAGIPRTNRINPTAVLVVDAPWTDFVIALAALGGIERNFCAAVRTMPMGIAVPFIPCPDRAHVRGHFASLQPLQLYSRTARKQMH